MIASDASYYEDKGLLNELLQDEEDIVIESTKPPKTHVQVEAAVVAVSAHGVDDAVDADDDVDNADANTDASASSKRRRRKRKQPSEWVRSENQEKLLNSVLGNKDKLLQKLADESVKSRIKVANAVAAAASAADASVTRKAAWHDSDEEGLHVDDVIDYERKGAPVVRKQGKYKVYLEQKFQSTLGTPSWAALDRRANAGDSESDDDVLTRTVGHLAPTTDTTTAHIKANRLQFKRMKDLNRAGYDEGPGITGIAFHPTSSVALVTGGSSGIASIYSIDGHRNDKLHSIKFDKFAIRSCRLNRSGSEAIIGGAKKFCYTYDLLSGATQRSFLPRTVTQMSRFELSPCGRYIAVKGRFGEVHVLDAASKELVVSLKQEHVCSALVFTGDSQQLLVHSNDAEVTVFDMRRHRALHRFNDEGCVNGSSLALSPNGRLLAAGSAQGVVNVYDYETVLLSANPRPLKTVFNLTTGITAATFNHTSELLAFGSKEIEDALKLVHCQTGTVYNNFPGVQGGIGRPQTVAFSPQSGYMAIGNSSKEVTLYRLKHFSNY